MSRMKTILGSGIGLLAVVALASTAGSAVEERSEHEERFVVGPAPLLEIDNIWGDVLVTSGPAGEITLRISEQRSAPSQELFERSLEVLKLDVQADSQTVSMQVGERDGRWSRVDPCRGCEVHYRFDVRVPADAQVDVSTVNEGRVAVSGVSGRVSAGNVNGPVSIADASDCEAVQSVNGDVSLEFRAAPKADCSIETINGDIRLRLPAHAGLDLALDPGQGRVFSELSVDPIALPARVEHLASAGGHRYRIAQAAGVRLAGGGPTFTVSSMNGDLQIQKNP